MLGAFAAATAAFFPALPQRRRLGRLFVLRNLVGRVFQIVQDFQRRRPMFLMEGQQLVEHVLPVQSAGMMVEPPAGDHLEHRA